MTDKKQSVRQERDVQQAIDKQAENEAVVSKALFELIIAIGNIEPADEHQRTLDRALIKDYAVEIIHGIESPDLLEKWAKTIMDAEVLFTVLKKLHSLPQKEPIKENKTDPYISLNNSTQHFAMQVWTELNSGAYDDALEILENQSDHKDGITPLLSAVVLVFWYVTGRKAWLKAGDPAQLSENSRKEIKVTLEESEEFYSISRTAEERVKYLQKIIERAESGIIRYNPQPVDSMIYPIEKVYDKTFSYPENDYDKEHNLERNIITTPQNALDNGWVTIKIKMENFSKKLEESGIKMTMELDITDKRLYTAAANIYYAGNEVTTTSQIFKTAFGRSPTANELEATNSRLTKLRESSFYLDNQGEDGKMNTPPFAYDGAILPFERVSATINGIEIKSAIHFLRDPPLMAFVTGRKRFTTFPPTVLYSPLRKTQTNMRIEDYLLQRIGHMKKAYSKSPRKMLYSTIYENCGITTKKQKQRAPDTINRCLDYYVEVNYIDGYTISKDGITIDIKSDSNIKNKKHKKQL